MPSARDVLTPDALAMLQAIAHTGSFAAAARAIGLVPSALTYRVRQVEDALDVLLFDRGSRQARLTPAGAELLREGARILGDLDAVANRVKRVATGWETVLTVAVDSVIARPVVLDLCEAFFSLASHSQDRPKSDCTLSGDQPEAGLGAIPTRLRLRDEVLSGTLEALTLGRADLAIGTVGESTSHADIQTRPLGEMRFVYAVAPHHPLAALPRTLTDADMRAHRAVAVADSVQQGLAQTYGLLGGQDVFTVASMQAKLEAQLRGMGGGFVPECMARGYIETGRLVVKETERPQRVVRAHYAWRGSSRTPKGRALQWWLKQLDSAVTRQALLAGRPVR